MILSYTQKKSTYIVKAIDVFSEYNHLEYISSSRISNSLSLSV